LSRSCTPPRAVPATARERIGADAGPASGRAPSPSHPATRQPASVPIRSRNPLPQGVDVLDNDLKAQLKGYLERLRHPVVITASVDDGDKSRGTLGLLQDGRGQSALGTVEVRPGADGRKPSFALSSPGHDISLRFAGLPMGHEFTSLVLALLQVGGHPPKATPEVLEQARA